MKSSRTIITLAAVAALGIGLGWNPLAQAQSASSNGAVPPAAQAPSTPASTAAKSNATAHTVKPRSDAQVEAQITQLHRELTIAAAQEDDWKQLAQDMRDNAHDLSTLIQQRDEAAQSKPMTAVDNLKNYQDIADAHADGLKKLVPDFEKLYDSMSPAQKKTADKVFNQRVNQRVHTNASPSTSATKD